MCCDPSKAPSVFGRTLRQLIGRMGASLEKHRGLLSEGSERGWRTLGGISLEEGWERCLENPGGHLLERSEHMHCFIPISVPQLVRRIRTCCMYALLMRVTI